MEYRKINLSGWEQVGEGGTGKTYANPDYPDTLLKLFHAGNEDSSAREYEMSLKVLSLGIPTAKPYELVTDGTLKGMTMEKLVGKKSFYRLLSEDISRMDEIAERFAKAARKLHSTTCDTGQFTSTKDKMREGIKRLEGITDKARSTVLSILESLEDCKTCLHGDLHAGNIVDVGGKDMWIDLGDFGYGDPMLDITRSYLLQRTNEEKTLNDFHITKAQNAEFIKRFFHYYFGPLSDQAQAELTRRLDSLCMVQYAFLASQYPQYASMLLPVLNNL